MNKDNAHLYLPLVKALAEGKTIQIEIGPRWQDLADPSFSDSPERYRIKPEPMEIHALIKNSTGAVITHSSEAIARSALAQAHATAASWRYAKFREVLDE